ncbi:MAG: ATP-binding cassette domain-containing protein [bacterium]|nr:ATP-binding cassette domain-containing protein [bacterium]
MSEQPAVAYRNVSFALGSGLQVFSDLNLDVPAGQRYVLMGTSRSGSSFFARLALGLYRPDRGSIRVLGRPVSRLPLQELHELRQRLGFVFRDARLISNLSAEGNISLPLNYHRTIPADVARGRVVELLELLSLGPVAGLRPVDLTPEQRMRVAFGRSVAMAPEVLFYDDPLVGFPSDVADRLLDTIERVRVWVSRQLDHERPPTMLVAVSESIHYEGFADRFGTFRDGKVYFEDRQRYLRF